MPPVRISLGDLDYIPAWDIFLSTIPTNRMKQTNVATKKPRKSNY